MKVQGVKEPWQMTQGEFLRTLGGYRTMSLGHRAAVLHKGVFPVRLPKAIIAKAKRAQSLAIDAGIAAHRQEVADALLRGYPVPEHVRRLYPDLRRLGYSAEYAGRSKGAV